MYLFNTTFVIVKEENEWWKIWMSRYYFPTFQDIMPKIRIELYKIDSAQDIEHDSYSCQLRCNTIQELGDIDKYSKSLLKNLSEQKGEKCLYFSTMMKEELL